MVDHHPYRLEFAQATYGAQTINFDEEATRRGGVVSIPGVYAGFIHGFLLGNAFRTKGSASKWDRRTSNDTSELLELIEAGRLQPAAIISHRMPLADAEKANKMFNEKEDNCRK